MKTVVTSLVIAGAVGLSVAQTAQADIVISFGYQQLSGNFTPGQNPGEGTFAAYSVSLPNSLQSTGFVNRETPTTGSANFAPGFDNNGPADGEFILILNLTNITNTSAVVNSGSFRIRDVGAVGDTISGDVTGTWNLTNPGLPFFSGTLTNVVYANNSGDNTFDGTIGSFGMGGLPPMPLSGQIQTLLIYFNLPQSFAAAFADVSTNVQGQLIPAPGALAMLGIGGLVATRRRR